jgi:hypothetical protein
LTSFGKRDQSQAVVPGETDTATDSPSIIRIEFDDSLVHIDTQAQDLAILSAAPGASYTVCDFSNAGQAGNNYRSRLPV